MGLFVGGDCGGCLLRKFFVMEFVGENVGQLGNLDSGILRGFWMRDF